MLYSFLSSTILLPILSLVLLPVAAQSPPTIRPASIPLAVHGPYLNAYLPNTDGSTLPNMWPQFWTGNRTLGWAGLVRVDGSLLFEWLGLTFEGQGLTLTGQNITTKAASLQSLEITPTRTVMSLDVGGVVEFEATFLSGAEISDPLLASLPFSYVFIDPNSIKSKDGKSHSIQFYLDLSGEWLSSADAKVISWSTSTSPSGNVLYHEASLEPGQGSKMTNGGGGADQGGMVEDGVLTLAGWKSSSFSLSSQTGGHHAVRSGFLNNGALSNNPDGDKNFRNINDDFPVFAISYDLGTVPASGLGSGKDQIVWALGLIRNPTVLYPTEQGTQQRWSIWMRKWSDVGGMLDANLSPSSTSSALSRSQALDTKILAAANQVSSQYADIVSLATRQVLGGWEVTTPVVGSDEDIMIFIKDVGNSQRAQPVEVLYAMWPAIMYLNATWGQYFLEPLLEYEGSKLYQAGYAAGDLGPTFPSITGSPSPNILRSLEDTGSMLIMAWTMARMSGNGKVIEERYDLFKKWTEQIIPNALAPNGFSSSDGQSSSNQTNLALKGILGIRAMAEMSKAMGKKDDQDRYTNLASQYISQWSSLAGSSGHLTSTYGDTSSWSLMYNLYADKLMGTGLVSDDIYTKHSQFIANQAQSAPTLGLAYDSQDPAVAKSHWTFLTASFITPNSARDTLISQVHAKAVDTKNPGVFPSTYNVNNGTMIGGSASPSIGGVFGLLALTLQPQTITNLDGSTSASKSSSNTGAIAGGVVGGLAVLALLVLGALWYRRRRAKADNRFKNVEGGVFDGPTAMGVAGGNEYQSGHQPMTREFNHYPTSYTSTSRQEIPNSYPYTSAADTNTIASRHSLLSSPSSQGQRYQHYPPAPSSSSQSRYTTSSGPLVLHNGDEGTSGGGFVAPQAPPLPSKKSLNGGNQVRLSVGSESVLFPSNRTNVTDATDGARDLRDEVEILRREMAEMRSRTGYEPPPQYQ